MRLSLLLSFVGALLVAGPACTKPNPAVCCLDAADCNEVGISEVRSCDPGLACVEHQCVVPGCAEAGCGAEAPVCNIQADVCEGCAESADCSRFPATPVCDVAGGGACVQCVGAADCSDATPVCEANACRACRLDSECPSGACGDDGACVPEAAIVYLDPGGTDSGSCTRDAPCRSLEFGISRTSPGRAHVVTAKGGYTSAPLFVAPQSTAAAQLFIHGGGATLACSCSGDGNFIAFAVPVTIRDVNIAGNPNFTALSFSARTLLERVRVSNASVGIDVTADVVEAIDVIVDNSYTGISLFSGTLKLDRGVIRNVQTGIAAAGNGKMVELQNLLVHDATALALDLSAGTVSFSTIADSGTDAGTGPRAVKCSPGAVTVRSSIVWAPGATTRVPMEGCNIVTTLAGPTPVAGASNSNPQFVDSSAGDYHLASSSPARDMVENGPSFDFEGDARPQGTRFDIGADEAAP